MEQRKDLTPSVTCSWPTIAPLASVVRRVETSSSCDTGAQTHDNRSTTAGDGDAPGDNHASVAGASSCATRSDDSLEYHSRVVATPPGLDGKAGDGDGDDNDDDADLPYRVQAWELNETPLPPPLPPPLEIDLRFNSIVRVTRLELATDARVVEWLVDGEYAGTSRTVSGSASDELPRATCPERLRPGKVFAARLRLLPDDGRRCVISDVAYAVAAHAATPMMHSFDMALVRERLGDGRPLSAQASELMDRIDLDHSRSGGQGVGGSGGAESMLGALAAAAAGMGMSAGEYQTAGRNGGLPPALASMAQMLATFGGGGSSGLAHPPPPPQPPALASAPAAVDASAAQGFRAGPLPPELASMVQMLAGFGGGAPQGASVSTATERKVDSMTSSTLNRATRSTSEHAQSRTGDGSEQAMEAMLARLEERMVARMTRLESKLDRILELIDGVDAS
jgi:hypothetical protein